MHPFRSAIEAGEVDRVLELCSPEVVFNSPVVFRRWRRAGVPIVAAGSNPLVIRLKGLVRVGECARH
jgi:hypothetical protein